MSRSSNRASSSRSRRAPSPPVDDEALVPDVVEEGPDTFERFMAVVHRQPMWVEQFFLQHCGLLDRFRELMDRCGWPGLLTLRSEADMDDTCEFLTGYHYVGPREFEGFRYTFRGEEHYCTMTRLRQIFGWPEVAVGAHVKFTNMMDISDTYMSLTGTRRYRPSDASSTAFRDPFWFMVQFILTRTLTARANGNEKPSIRDLTILGALVRGVVPHWGHFLCAHLKQIKPRGPLCVGGMVTYILRSLHPDVDALPGHKILAYGLADSDRVGSGRTFRLSSEGAVRWTYFADPDLRPPPSPPRRRGRPPGRGGPAGGRRRPRDGVEVPLNVVPPEEQQPGEYTQAQIDHLFNMNRAMMMAMGSGFHPVSAPPGWRPGHAIPPEYTQPPPDY